MWSLAPVAQLAWSSSICAARQSFQCCCMLTMSPCQGSSACKHECVCAPSFTVLLSSHNQWPFSLRWWMREKCSVSKHVGPTVLSLSVFLVLLVFLHALSAPILIHVEPLKVNNLHCCQLMQAYLCTLDECRHTHVCFAMQTCDSSPLPPTSAWFAATITRRSCRSSICGWC